MRECRQCGFPRKFANHFDWREDGTIVSTDRAGTRAQISLLNAGEFESIFDGLSHSIGLKVEPFLVKAQKEIGRAIYNYTPLRYLAHFPNNRFFRPSLFARAAVRMSAYDVAALGTGRVRLDQFKAGEYAVVRFRYPCLNPLLAGSASGIYESVEGIPDSRVEFELDAGDLVVRLSHAEAPNESPDVEGRFHYEPAVPAEGPVRYGRCRECGVPVLAGLALEWDIKRGVIKNRLTGEREVLVAVQAVNAILRELELELGEGIPDIIYGHQKALSMERLEGILVLDPDRFWDEYLTELALRGMGYPFVFERDSSSGRVEIVNAYNQVLYAAKLAAAFEAVSGAPSKIEWERRDCYHGIYRISTVDSG